MNRPWLKTIARERYSGNDAAANGKTVQNPRPIRVLIVEDDEDTAESFANLLMLHGCIVETCFSSHQCLETLKKFQPEVVLLDIGLPQMNGYALARAIRQVEGYRGVLLIAITGYGQLRDRARSKAAGIDHHLVKPVNVDDVLTLMRARIAK